MNTDTNTKPEDIRTTMRELVARAMHGGHDLSRLEFRMSPEAYGNLLKCFHPDDLLADPVSSVVPLFMGIPIDTNGGHPVTGFVQLCDQDTPRKPVQLRIA